MTLEELKAILTAQGFKIEATQKELTENGWQPCYGYRPDPHFRRCERNPHKDLLVIAKCWQLPRSSAAATLEVVGCYGNRHWEFRVQIEDPHEIPHYTRLLRRAWNALNPD